MRLALIRQRYTPYGGAERFIEGALEALLERNVAITLYTREWPQTNLHLIEPHICDPFYLGNLWRDWGFARAVSRAVGTTKANLVQSHERLLCCDIYRAGDGVHAVWLEERLRGASALSRLGVMLNPWHHYTLRMEKKLFASPWLRARYKIPAEATVFLLVGSGYERKGVATAIAALAELPASAHLMVVGREKHINRYERLAHSLGVHNRIAFAGQQMDVKPYYGAADVFVLPTIYDPFPNAALEAMACALPVITSPKSGAAELVTENDAGLVCPSRDVAGLAAHMRTLLDVQTRNRLGTNARRAIEPLTPSAMTLQLVLIYKELLEASVAHRAQPKTPHAEPPTTAKSAATESAREAPPLHGEDGLASESLPAPPAADDQRPLL